MFCKFKNRFKTFLAKSHHKYSKLNESILKRFFLKQKTLNIFLQKNLMGLKFCMEVDILSADENLIKRIKKVWGKKSSCWGSNQDLNETNGYFKFPRHPQKLVQNNNWFRMVYYTATGDSFLILIWTSFSSFIVGTYFCITLLFYA